MPEETTPAILAAVNAVMNEVRSISKTGKMEVRGGPNYNFRKADDVVNELGEAFRKFSIMPQSQILKVETESYETLKRDERYGDKLTHWHRSIITVRYSFTSLVDGSTLVAEGVGEGLDSGDKSVPKAMTGAMKSAFTQAYAIAFKDMADPDNERPEYQDETETDAQRVLRERREVQAKQAGPPSQPTVTAANSIQTVDQRVTEAPQPTMATGTDGVTEQVQEPTGDPLTDGVETLKTELGAREMNPPQGSVDSLAELADLALDKCSQTLANLVKAGGDWVEASPKEMQDMQRAVAAAEGPTANLELVNKIILHADELGLLIRPFAPKLSLGKKLWIIRQQFTGAQS